MPFHCTWGTYCPRCSMLTYTKKDEKVDDFFCNLVTM